jgi:hypothetical protein
MSRRERLFALMARRQKIELGQKAATAQRAAMRAADADRQAEQLGNLLAEKSGTLARSATKADMLAAHWMGVELAAHLEITRNNAAHLEQDLIRARAELAQAEHRSGLYHDRAAEARREAREAAEARREAARPTRRGPASA